MSAAPVDEKQHERKDEHERRTHDPDQTDCVVLLVAAVRGPYIGLEQFGEDRQRQEEKRSPELCPSVFGTGFPCNVEEVCNRQEDHRLQRWSHDPDAERNDAGDPCGGMPLDEESPTGEEQQGGYRSKGHDHGNACRIDRREEKQQRCDTGLHDRDTGRAAEDSVEQPRGEEVRRQSDQSEQQRIGPKHIELEPGAQRGAARLVEHLRPEFGVGIRRSVIPDSVVADQQHCPERQNVGDECESNRESCAVAGDEQSCQCRHVGFPIRPSITGSETR